MPSVKATSFLLLLGTALAMPVHDLGNEKRQPQWHGHGPPSEVTVTTIVTEGPVPTMFAGHQMPGQFSSTVSSAAASPSDDPNSSDDGDDSGDDSDNSNSAPSSQPKNQAAPSATSTASAPKSTSTGSSSSGGSDSSSNAYMTQINKYRGEMNRKTLTFDSKLQANALKTVTDDNGTMKHELNPGSMAQVLAEGKCTDDGFVDALVQGWICEMPSLLPSGTCKSGSYSSNGETGHAEILSSTSYTKTGCACVDGIWGCDFS